MFDDLRGIDEEDDGSMFEEPAELAFDVEEVGPRRGYFLGMTPVQRFLISLLLLGTVIVLGAMCLMVTQKVML
ncbi:MAG: hypothetical protein KAJ55_11945 [Anaerolineales bacterium]|nr:hypothetical protein [Anaerolineales bacterium]